LEALVLRLAKAAEKAKGSAPHEKHQVELSYGDMLALMRAIDLVLAIRAAQRIN
jgi:hypothetical protein